MTETMEEIPIDPLAHCNCSDMGQGQYEDEVGQIHCDYCNKPIYEVVGLLLEIWEVVNWLKGQHNKPCVSNDSKGNLLIPRDYP